LYEELSYGIAKLIKSQKRERIVNFIPYILWHGRGCKSNEKGFVDILTWLYEEEYTGKNNAVKLMMNPTYIFNNKIYINDYFNLFL